MSSEPGVFFDQNSGSTTTLCCPIHFYLERERARPFVWLGGRICIRGICVFHLNMPFKSYPVKETFDSRQITVESQPVYYQLITCLLSRLATPHNKPAFYCSHHRTIKVWHR